MLSWRAALLLVGCAALAAAERRYHADTSSTRPRLASGQDPDEITAEYWRAEASAAIRRRVATHGPAGGRARSLVMFLGDGMSVPTLAAARTLLGQRQDRPGEEAQLFFEDFPTVGLAKTYCVDQQIPDSACTATAYLCGVKTNYGTLGVTAQVPRYDCEASLDPATHLESIAAWALEDGRDVGIVTTTRITHASPAGVYANTANRNWENDADITSAGFNTSSCPDIADQLINMEPGKRFKVILGGGRRNFLPNNVTDDEGFSGFRGDNRNLIEEWINDKIQNNVDHKYVWDRQQLMDMFESPPEYLLGLFESNHLQYHEEANKLTEPTLAELTEIAIRSLSRNEKGFFLFVEGGRIDHAHHDNYVHLALDETLQLSEAVERAAAMLPEDDSLLVVTADHSHVMAYNGYSRRGNNILGPSDDSGDDNVPYMTLSYTNGPGARPRQSSERTNVLDEENFGTLRWRSHAEVPVESETHGGEDVAVFARGPQHGMFSGLYEQSQLPHLMAYAGCLGADRHEWTHCNSAHVMRPSLVTAALIAFCLLLRSCHLIS